VHAEPSYAADRGGNTPGTKEVKEGMGAFWVVDMEVPELVELVYVADLGQNSYHCLIRAICLRVSLMAAV
jgi:hypothetical protein